ncbi:MAG: hypothetical protein H0T75_04325 [Rhizobiales bacterium]|nr:hypothetical protein [Hyphomicrobiales bacterium]
MRILVNRGRPDVLSLAHAGGEIRFPITRVYDESTDLHTAGTIPNAIAVAAWMDQERFLQRLCDEIDEVADDDAAIPDADRAAQEAALSAQILAAWPGVRQQRNVRGW